MRLLKYEGYTMTFEPALLSLKVFKELHNRDKSKTKERFIQELSFIYFMIDPRSDYQYIIDEDERTKAIIEGEGLPADWKPDKKVEAAMSYYATFKPTSALLLEDTRVAVDKLRKALKNIDLRAVDDKGKPIYTLNVITSTIKQVPSLIKDLDSAERSITNEMEAQGRAKGGNNKTLLDDGFDNFF